MKQQIKRLIGNPRILIFPALAVVLSLVLLFSEQFRILISAENNGTSAKYVSEVRIYQGSTEEKARDACRADGFIPVEGNLNEGTDYDAVVMGYVTTENPDEAITDIRMMQMTSGFSTVNYTDLVARQYPGLDSMIDEQYATIREFREKIANGNYNAGTALKYLNLFKIPEINMKLGDYFISDSLDKAMLKKLFLQTTAVISTTVWNLLTLGVSDSSEDNWASRVYQNKDILDIGNDDEDSVDAGTDPFADLDRKYLSSAERLVMTIQDFSTKVQNGQARTAANGGEIPRLDPETASEEELNAHAAEPLCMTAYEVLNLYRYDDDTLLGDWLVDMGSRTLSNKAELRELYPLIASMSFGQIMTAQLTGFHLCTFYLTELSAADDKFTDAVNQARAVCSSYDHTDAVSVWEGVDQKLFEAECAVTGDAQRYTNVKETMDNLVRRSRGIEVLEQLSTICTWVTSIAGGLIALFQLPTMIVTWLGAGQAPLLTISWCWHHGTMFFVFGLLGKVASFIAAISKILFLVTLVIMLVVFLYELFKPECDDLTYTKIPAMAMDLSVDGSGSGTNGLLRYDLIQSPDRKGDLNAYEGKQWNALYSSQNTDAGKPIQVTEGKAPFIIKYNDAENPAGFKAVRNFDEIYAANLNANVREDDAPAIFLFCALPGESAGTTEVKEEDIPKTTPETSSEESTAESSGTDEPAPETTASEETGSSETGSSETETPSESADETASAVTDPAETTPSETESTETEPTESVPTETESTETVPTESESTETAPTETSPTETVPSETEPTETAPTKTEPTETSPAETEPAPPEKKLYISSLYLSCEESETLAKLQLTQKGYYVVDVNLTPSVRYPNKYGFPTVRAYTYLGYKTTENEKAAITDIRIAKLKSTSQGMIYGTVRYTAAGYDGHNHSICYTKDTAAGSPILADDIQIANKFSDRKEGYEPVAYFGGTAYNFDACEEFDQWDKGKYIFFSPSDKYTSGAEYVSGIFLVSGANITRNGGDPGLSLAEYAGQLGGKLLGNADLTKGREWKKWDKDSQATFKVNNMRTYLCYTTTHNPKRAIYDVQFYAGTPTMQNFIPVLTAFTGNSEANYAQTGYGITSVFMQSAKKMVIQQTDEVGWRSKVQHYEINNYDDFTLSSGENYQCYDKLTDNIIPGVSWQSVTSQPRMLYACGYKNGYAPLTPGDLVLSNSSTAPAGFASVQDVRFPFEKEPLNLAYSFHEKSSDCTPVYLYIHRNAPVRGRYIASVSAASYNPQASWSEDERRANDAFSNDLCYISLLGSSSEIITHNLSLLPADAWYNKTGERGDNSYGRYSVLGSYEYDATAAYLGVTYTDNPAKAVHGLLRLRAQAGKEPSETLTVNGAKYSLVQNVTSQKPVPITSPNGMQYYLYTTTSSGGSSTGDPVEGIQISEAVFEAGMSTVLTVDHGDIPAEKDFYGKTIKEAEYVLPFGDTDEVLYIHLKSNGNLTGIDSFFVGVGGTRYEAWKDLLSQGATSWLPLNMNENSGENAFVYIGYHHYNPDYVNTRRTKYTMESAVKDLLVYVGSNPQKRLTINNRKYTLCSEHNLNYGTSGTEMYLYQTTALINDKDKNDASYITAISAAQYDRVPEDIAEVRWENLLTTDNKRINLNDGVRGHDYSDSAEHIIDSRVFVFIHRNDNYVKPEAVITGGYSTDTTIFGDLVLEKKS